MDEILYSALIKYYHALELKGYMSLTQSAKLLVLGFYEDFIFHDYKALLTREDYILIERALDCMYGSSCLIPYPDYLKMGKLHLGEMSEMAQRLKNLEESNVVKVIQSLGDASGDSQSDVSIMVED
jgi:hypothetical protein